MKYFTGQLFVLKDIYDVSQVVKKPTAQTYVVVTVEFNDS